MNKAHRAYHRHSIRHQEWNYSGEASYFITMCTQDRKCLFGRIRNREMENNNVGIMIEHWWQQLPHKFTTIELDAFQIMPNHFHGIIHVGADLRVRPTPSSGQTHGSAPTDDQSSKNPSLGIIIQWFKTMSTNSYIRLVRSHNAPIFHKRLWQRNYYEHIIRNEQDLLNVRYYLEQNPTNWKKDENFYCAGR